MAAQPDVGGPVVFSDQGPGCQHGEAGVTEHIVGDEGAQLSQHPPGTRAPPGVESQCLSLVHQVVGPPLPMGGAVGLPPRGEWGAAACGGLVVHVPKLRQQGGEAALQQLHIVLLGVAGEEGRRRQVGQEKHLGPLDGGPAGEVPALVAHPLVHPAHAWPGVALGVILQAVIQSLVQALTVGRAAEALGRLAVGQAVLLVQRALPPFSPVHPLWATQDSGPQVPGISAVAPMQGAGAVFPAHPIAVPQEEQQ